MNHRLLHTGLAVLMPVAILAQTPPPPPGGAPPGFPLPGIVALLAAAVGYGIYKLNIFKPKK